MTYNNVYIYADGMRRTIHLIGEHLIHLRFADDITFVIQDYYPDRVLGRTEMK